MAYRVIFGDCRKVLEELKAEGFTCRLVLTSPPYWNLRDNRHPEQIGLEPTIEEYINALVNVFQKVRSVLTDDGSLFLVMGDLYERKCQQLLPARVALSLIEDGWILRNDIIWYKPNAAPMSVKDRLKNCYEHIFHFTKNHSYYYNLDAIREPHKSKGTTGWEKVKAQRGGNLQPKNRSHFRLGREVPFEHYFHPLGKNPGDVWEIKVKPFPEAHGSVFPEELCVRPIRACTEPGDWVLDPFCGTGTVLQVALEYGRNAVGIEINQADYEPIIKKRLRSVQRLLIPQ